MPRIPEGETEATHEVSVTLTVAQWRNVHAALQQTAIMDEILEVREVTNAWASSSYLAAQVWLQGVALTQSTQEVNTW